MSNWHNATCKPLTADVLSGAMKFLEEQNQDGVPLNIRPYEYPPISYEMKVAMDEAGWGDTEVAEFFSGTRELLGPNGKRWVYGPMWDLVHSKDRTP